MKLRFLGQTYNAAETSIPEANCQTKSHKFQFVREILTYRGVSYINTIHSRIDIKL